MTEAEEAKLATLDDRPENMRLSCQVRCCDDLIGAGPAPVWSTTRT